MIAPPLLQLLVCPVSKAPLVLSEDGTELWCKASALAYPIKDGIPIMLEQAARPLSSEEKMACADSGYNKNRSDD